MSRYILGIYKYINTTEAVSPFESRENADTISAVISDYIEEKTIVGHLHQKHT